MVKYNLLIYLLTHSLTHLLKNLKQAFNHGLVLKTVHRVIEFNQNA